MSYKIWTDSSCDLTPAMLNELGVGCSSLDVIINDEPPKANDQVEPHAFYEALRAGAMAKTAAANRESFIEAFEPVVAAGEDLLYIGFSSGLSATYQAAAGAAEDLREKYPQRKIYTVDTLAASMGEGLLVYLAVQKQKEGASIEEVRDYLEANKLHLCHWFTVNDLFFLKRGGRVSAATAVLGSMLAIKPVMHVDNDGHLINVGKARGRKASIQELFNKMKTTAVDPASQTVFISHGDCLEEAEYLGNMIREQLQPKAVLINHVGPVIGAHSGPGTMALFFLGTER